MTTFFDEVTRCVVESDAARGLDLLQHFNEPKETRLGLSKEGIDGHGGDDEIGARIWAALTTDLEALVRVGILKWIEDVPVFVEGVDKDITSDLTTRLIFEPLSKFTQAMVEKYPQFTAGDHEIKSFRRPVWRPSGAQPHWVFKSLDLPVAAGKPLLLVPKYWARPRLLMSGGRYYGTSVLSYVQNERAVRDRRTGKLIKEPKRLLRERDEFERGQDTVVRVTREAKNKREDLLATFRAFVDERYERLDPAEIDRRLRRRP